MTIHDLSYLYFTVCREFDPIQAYEIFLRYKERVPVCGAILISQNWKKCLVVQGWKSGAAWSFPRGKINQGEDERDCAVREVLQHAEISTFRICYTKLRTQVWEETGYNIAPHFNPNIASESFDFTTCPPPLPPASYPEDDWIEVLIKQQRIRLYVIPGISEDTLFETKTRKEISVSEDKSSAIGC